MQAPLSLARRLADVLAGTDPGELPPAVLAHAHRAVLDWLGSAIAGAHEPPARMAQRVVAGFGTAGEATMFGVGRASAPAAAFANGVAAHILELDDIHKGSTVHGAAPIVSAALAVAEREGATGRTCLAAVARGYEAAFRIGEAVNPGHYRFWHPTGTVGTFGAAVAAGTLVGLDAEQLTHALGSAGTQAAGLWEFNADGAMSKHLHAGKAALDGVLAADLARAGFTGARRILEGDRGFFRAMSLDADATRITDGLGTRWKIGENGYKLHACCGHTHTAIDAAIAIRARRRWPAGEVPAAIAAIEVDTYGPGYEIVREPNPRSAYQAKFSLPYCVAAALVEGAAGLEQFHGGRFGPDGARDPAVAALLARTRVRAAADLTSRYPQAWPVRLRLVLRDGTREEEARDYPIGHPEHPVSTEQLRDKCRALVAGRAGPEMADAALRALDALPDCEDVRLLFRTSCAVVSADDAAS
jgi:2-methylcitrate dehydratase PrpD